MPEYIIKWDVGFGESYSLVDADNEEAARTAAYESAREDFESQHSWGVVGLATPELKEEYNL
jgi:hypothetical protein